MARTWLNEGKPLADGRLCLVIDPEDGTNPIRVWGRSREEILDKAAKTVEHGIRTITGLRTQIHSTAPPPSSASAKKPNGEAPAHPTKLTAAEQMQATADLDNPSKAPQAITRLLEHHTGIDFQSMQQKETLERIATIQANWSAGRPDFPQHPTNYTLLNNAATIRAGGYEKITSEIMDEVFNELLAQGLLVEPGEPPAEEEPPPPTVQPAETLESRTVRPRGATSHRRTATGAAAVVPAQTPKYTREQIQAMTSAEYRRKLETDPAFVQAVAAYAGQPPARA